MPRQPLESDFDGDSVGDSRRLSTAQYSDDSSMMSGVIPGGSKLFGCMAVFFLFSGGFVGSLFALDTFEEPNPYKFNARILKYPGPPSKNCSAYDVCSLTGVVSLTPVVVDGDIDESQVRVKLIANGILGNITMVSLHDGVSCDYRNEVYTEMYKQQPAKIYGMKEWESGDLDEEATTATPLVTLAVSPTKVVYVSGSQPYVSSFRFKKDQTCTPDGGVFGDDLEDVKSATVSDRNISGLVHLTAKSSSVVEVSMALSVPTPTSEALLPVIGLVKVFSGSQHTNCTGEVLFETGDVSGDQDEYGKVNVAVDVAWTNTGQGSLFDRPVGVFNGLGGLMGCGAVPGSIYEANNITTVGGEVAFDSGKNIKHIQGKAVVIYDNGGSEVGCGIVPGDPYKEHDMVSQYSHETRKNGKRVTVEFTISTGYEFVDFKNKIVVLNDGNGAPVGCGVLKDEES